MAPTPDEIRRQLDRLLESPVFANATRMRRFLRYAVEETLEGRGERLKEYAIGVEVFDRDAEYDTRVDSIVRVEAGRLRAKLDEYYGGEGRDDAVIVRLPKGGYTPVITRREPVERRHEPGAVPTEPDPGEAAFEPVPAVRPRRRAAGVVAPVAVLAIAAVALALVNAPWTGRDRSTRPTVAVLPFSPYSDDAAEHLLAMRLTEGVTAELVRTGALGVVSSTSVRHLDVALGRLRDVARALDADVLVEARIVGAADRVRVEARAVSGRLEQKFWVETFSGPADELDDLERQIAGGIAAALEAVPSTKP